MMTLTVSQFKRKRLSDFERELEQAMEDIIMGKEEKKLICNDMGRITDVRVLEDYDSYSLSMEFQADCRRCYFSIRPGWVAKFGCILVMSERYPDVTICCGDPRVIYLYWRSGVDFWQESHRIARRMKAYARKHQASEQELHDVYERFYEEGKITNARKLNDSITTMEKAECWLYSQGLSCKCVPQGKYWEQRYYPWWNAVTRGKIK